MAKMAIFGFWAIFRGLARAQKSKLQKSETSGDIHLESPKNLTWPNLNKPATAKFGGTMSPKSPISAIFSLIKSPKMAKNQFLSQNDSRYINSPSKWTYKTKIMVGFVGTDGRTFRRSSSTEVEKNVKTKAFPELLRQNNGKHRVLH